jgi:hypothetical protein
MTRLSAFILVGCCAACSTHNSSLKRDGSAAKLYVVDDEARVFAAGFGAMTEVFQHDPVIDIDGPIRGFRVHRTFLGDDYRTILRIFRASGHTGSGDLVKGYYFEVTGEGSLFDGPSGDHRVFGETDRRLVAIGHVVEVTGVERTDYVLDRDRWRLRGGAGDVATPKGSMQSRLEELEELKRKGLVTTDEYASKRKAILEDL